jgi:hypothetical protein
MIRPSLILLLPLSLGAAPALAQAAPAPAPQLAVDRATAGRIADSMQALSKALLDLHIGEVQAALEGREATAAEKKLTVRDLGRRDDPNFEGHLQQRIAEARPQIEHSIKAFNEALPKITEDLQRAQKSIERAMANMPDPNYPKR